MRLGIFTKYDEQGASSRVRFYNYRDHLSAAGIECTFFPMLDKTYLHRRYSADRAGTLRQTVAAVGQRVADLRHVPRFDALWIEYELFPYGLAIFERLLNFWDVPFVADYDDAIFHNYDLSTNPIVRRVLAKKIDRVMKCASAVTAGNSYLADRAARSGAREIVDMPTVVAAASTAASSSPPNDGITRIGWIGTPVTVAYLNGIRESLRLVAARRPIEIVLIGVTVSPFDELPVRCVPWSALSESSELAKLDIGIMPLVDTPWERGKCAYKLIQYMAAARPVVASPVGMNVEVVRHGINGYLAPDQNAWVQSLLGLIDDPGKRVQMGQAGRAVIERSYTYDVTAPRLIKLFKSLM